MAESWSGAHGVDSMQPRLRRPSDDRDVRERDRDGRRGFVERRCVDGDPTAGIRNEGTVLEGDVDQSVVGVIRLDCRAEPQQSAHLFGHAFMNLVKQSTLILRTKPPASWRQEKGWCALSSPAAGRVPAVFENVELITRRFCASITDIPCPVPHEPFTRRQSEERRARTMHDGARRSRKGLGAR